MLPPLIDSISLLVTNAMPFAFPLLIASVKSVFSFFLFVSVDSLIPSAAADMLNSNIIARELGLSDKVQNEHTGANGEAIQHAVSIKIEFDDE